MSDDDQSKTTRRQFLKTAAVGAAAAGAAVAVVPGASFLMSSSLPVTSQLDGIGSDDHEALVAYVADPARGEIVIMRGAKEIVLKDVGLASRLLSMIVG